MVPTGVANFDVPFAAPLGVCWL